MRPCTLVSLAAGPCSTQAGASASFLQKHEFERAEIRPALLPDEASCPNPGSLLLPGALTATVFLWRATPAGTLEHFLIKSHNLTVRCGHSLHARRRGKGSRQVG